MNPRQIDSFFQALSREFEKKARIILTGAAAGNLMGPVRASMDIDFCIIIERPEPKAWKKFEEAVLRTVRLTGIQANYAADIDRWGMVSLLDYKKHTHPYRRFGKLEVRILDPAYWSIGKLTRYLDPDVKDLVKVLKSRKIPYLSLVRLWGKALKASPPSANLSQFRRQAEHFLKTYGLEIWGKRFNLKKALQVFQAEPEGPSPVRFLNPTAK